MKNSANKNSWFFYDFVKATGIIPGLIYFRPRTIFLHKETSRFRGKALVVANHNSFTDPVLLLLSFPFRRMIFVATKDLFKSKLGNWFFTHVHCIKVDKENFNMSTFRGVSNGLNNGNLVAIFPEGAVDTKNDEIHPFKAGAVLMALKNHAPIIPVFISKKEKGKRQTVLVGDPIDVTLMESSVTKINEYLQKKELELKNIFSRGEF